MREELRMPGLEAVQSNPVSTREHRPSRQDVLREYEIRIEFLSVGCIIRVGCKSIPFATVKDGMKALNDYVATPYETRKVWEEIFTKEEEL